jgi:hypothetical protein
LVFVGGVVCGCGMEACESPGGPAVLAPVEDAAVPEEASTPDAFTVGSGESGASSSEAGVGDSFATDGEGSSDDAALNAADAGQPEAAAEAGDGGSCFTSGTELCDGFESGQLDPTIWKTVLLGRSASVTVDGTHPHSGKYAVHVSVTPGQQSTAQITEGATFPATDDTFYTRIWVYISPNVTWPSNPPDFHTGFIVASGRNDLGPVDLAVGANLSPGSAAGPMHYLGYSIYHGPPYVEFGPRSPTQVVNGAWTCIELLESGKGGMAAVRRIWVDDTELAEQYSTFSGQKPPQLDRVSIGIWEYHPTPSLSDMWIDDVRVGSQRIGCGS